MFLVALATADRRFLECIFFLLQIFSFCVKNSARDWGLLRSIRIYNPLQFGWLLTVVARGWVNYSTDDDRNCKRRIFVRQVFSLFLQQCTFFSFISNIVIFLYRTIGRGDRGVMLLWVGWLVDSPVASLLRLSSESSHISLLFQISQMRTSWFAISSV